MYEYSNKIVGPTMYEYTKWVLLQAHARGLKRIYFLARDGYLLCEMAKMLSQRHGLDIDCRYLYCSRSALRMPSYHVMQRSEMYDILLLSGYYVTPKTLLERGRFTDSELQRLYDELDITEPDKTLNEGELNQLREKITRNEFYKQTILERSRQAYNATIDYFKAEGLLDNDYIAIVDSGWTGSMQRSMRQLLEAHGYTGRIVGFYFGMYTSPKCECDGEYNTFYFNKKKGDKRKLYFNNNLFECMLSAPHAMTLYYDYDKSGKAIPVLASDLSASMLELINAQLAGALDYTKQRLEQDTISYDYKKSIRLCFSLLKRAMVYPTRAEAELLSSFTFCDDITENYSLSIASEQMRGALKNYTIFRRIITKLRGKKQTGEGELFWPYGVVAFCPKIQRPLYRFNILLWDLLKLKLKK